MHVAERGMSEDAETRLRAAYAAAISYDVSGDDPLRYGPAMPRAASWRRAPILASS